MRWGSFIASPVYDPKRKYAEFEITSDPDEWKHVENLFMNKNIAEPPKEAPPNSKWYPVSGNFSLQMHNILSFYYLKVKSNQFLFYFVDEAKKLPYFLSRTKNHQVPVYLRRYQNGLRRITEIRKIEGDIYQLEKELRPFVEQEFQRRTVSHIDEYSGILKFHGDFVEPVKKFLRMKGI